MLVEENSQNFCRNPILFLLVVPMKHKNASLRLAPALDEKMENFTALLRLVGETKNFFYYKKQKKRNLVELFVDSAEGYCNLNMAVNVKAAHKRRISLSNEKPR